VRLVQTSPLRVAVVGSRQFPNWEMVMAFVAALQNLEPDAVVVSGGARGVDSYAEEAADFYGMAKKIWLPDWELRGRSAGFLRNKEIVLDSDITVAFWDGISKGTSNTIGQSRTRRHPVLIYDHIEPVLFDPRAFIRRAKADILKFRKELTTIAHERNSEQFYARRDAGIPVGAVRTTTLSA
jgi:hypothetical protein